MRFGMAFAELLLSGELYSKCILRKLCICWISWNDFLLHLEALQSPCPWKVREAKKCLDKHHPGSFSKFWYYVEFKFELGPYTGLDLYPTPTRHCQNPVPLPSRLSLDIVKILKIITHSRHFWDVESRYCPDGPVQGPIVNRHTPYINV